MANPSANTGMAILEKAGAVVAALERLGEANAQDIATDVGAPVSSVYRLLANLTELGWVDSGSRRGLYRLGLDVIRFGAQIEERLDVRGACYPALLQLREHTRETAFLCYRREDLAVCVERIPGRDVQTLGMRLGDAFPLYSGAAPLVILSFLPHEEQEAILSRYARARESGESIPGESTLSSRIARTRELGYAVSDEDVTPGVAAIGAAIYNHRGELEGAISLSGLRDRILEPSNGIARVVVEAAANCSAALGHIEAKVAI